MTNLESTYLRLRPDATAEPLPVGPDFWPNLMAGKLGDFHHEFLVTTHAFDASWTNWEMHPNGDEIICLITGSVDLTFERDGVKSALQLRNAGDFALVKQGTWHTADPLQATRLLFITAGEGTTHRPR